MASVGSWDIQLRWSLAVLLKERLLSEMWGTGSFLGQTVSFGCLYIIYRPPFCSGPSSTLVNLVVSNKCYGYCCLLGKSTARKRDVLQNQEGWSLFLAVSKTASNVGALFPVNTDAPDIFFNLNIFVECSKMLYRVLLSTIYIPRWISLALAVDQSALLISLNFMEVTAVSCYKGQSQLVLSQFIAVFCAIEW